MPYDFEDPLENYDPPEYADELEQMLDEAKVTAIESSPFLKITTGTTIESAVQSLTEKKVAWAMVEEGGKLAGVFADRDILNRVALDYEKLKGRPVSEVMTRDPLFVRESDSVGAALAVMAVMGHRHVPVVDADHQVVGVVSPQRVTRFLLESLGN